MDDADDVGFEIANHLSVNTTTHFHGLHLPAKEDGGPYQIIPPNKTWKPSWRINQLASTQWYHPHLEGYTGKQVYKGMKGHTILVNGRPVPTLNAPAQVIRLRILNGSNARIYNLGFEGDIQFYQIASGGGFLEKSVALTRVLLGPAERVEILLDLGKSKGKTLLLKSFNAEYYDKQKFNGHQFGGPFKVGGTGRLSHSVDALDKINFDIMSVYVNKSTNANAVKKMPNKLTKITRLKESPNPKIEIKKTQKPQLV